MTGSALLAVVGLLFAWSLVSGRVERLDVSGPIVFVVAGVMLCHGPVSILDISVDTASVHRLAEITLVLVLFADAAQVDPRDLRHAAGLPVRLLAIGLPLTFAVGAALAAALFTDLPWELAALLGAVLSPTDAALSAAVVGDASVPERIRRSLNVESGLNDGIATPAVTGFLAAATVVVGVGTFEDTASSPGTAALADLAGGLVVGVLAGYVGGLVVGRARAAGWIAPGGRRIAVLMVPLMAFEGAALGGVNYFVAAFVAGLGFRAAMRVDDEEATELPELIGRVLGLVVWFLFGAALLVDGLERIDWRIALYAAASLTVVRMVPVALSMIGSRSGAPATLFVGWFGPRGLASVVFGLLIVEELPLGDPRVDTVLSVIVVTVLGSVIAHGVSARPLVAWLAEREGRGGGEADQRRPGHPHGSP